MVWIQGERLNMIVNFLSRHGGLDTTRREVEHDC